MLGYIREYPAFNILQIKRKQNLIQGMYGIIYRCNTFSVPFDYSILKEVARCEFFFLIQYIIHVT